MQKFRLLYLNLQLQDRELWAGCWYTLLPCVSKTMFLCFFIFLIQFRFFPSRSGFPVFVCTQLSTSYPAIRLNAPFCAVLRFSAKNFPFCVLLSALAYRSGSNRFLRPQQPCLLPQPAHLLDTVLLMPLRPFLPLMGC